MFMVTRALNAGMPDLSDIWKNILRGALIGFVLGYGYGYMANPNLPESKLLVKKTKKVLAGIVTLLAIVIPIMIWFVSPTRATSPRWDFDNSTEDWGEYIHLSSPQISDGSLTLRSTGIDPSFVSPDSLIPASDTPVITVRMRISQGQGTRGQIFFLTNQDSNWDEAKSVLFTLTPGAIFRTYNILMSENPAWRGTITKIRFDPVDDPSGTDMQFAIDYISVHAP